MYRVFESLEELKRFTRNTTDTYFWRSLIPFGDRYLALCDQPESRIHSGLQEYNYYLNASGMRATSLRMRMKFQVHQLTEWVKRELGLDSRGPIWNEIARRLGHPDKTPEEVFPLVGRNSIAGYEYVERIDFIDQRDQNEVGDVEHPYHRSRLEHNNAVSTRATNHSYNCRIVTTQRHENNGTGDHNFAHVHIEYSPNSVENEQRGRAHKKRRKQ